MDQQNQAIKKQEEERRRSEAELIRQQQIALMEAQRDEQQKRMRDDRGKFILGKQMCLPLWLSLNPKLLKVWPLI